MNAPVQKIAAMQEVIYEKQIAYTKTLAANSYEFGKVGNRHKLYWETKEELASKIQDMKDLGLWEESFEAPKDE